MGVECGKQFKAVVMLLLRGRLPNCSRWDACKKLVYAYTMRISTTFHLKGTGTFDQPVGETIT